MELMPRKKQKNTLTKFQQFVNYLKSCNLPENEYNALVELGDEIFQEGYDAALQDMKMRN
jgi:hypothetical protein